MDQLIELALKMPPSVSAALSIITMVVIYRLGKRILTKLDDHSTKLTQIEVQTTKTNGRVLMLETVVKTHDDLDIARHEDNLRIQTSTRENIHKLRDQISAFVGKLLAKEDHHA
jgi:hypothetical protein